MYKCVGTKHSERAELLRQCHLPSARMFRTYSEYFILPINFSFEMCFLVFEQGQTLTGLNESFK